MGLDVVTRAEIHGQSVETNLKYYTFARTDKYFDEVAEKLNAEANKEQKQVMDVSNYIEEHYRPGRRI